MKALIEYHFGPCLVEMLYPLRRQRQSLTRRVNLISLQFSTIIRSRTSNKLLETSTHLYGCRLLSYRCLAASHVPDKFKLSVGRVNVSVLFSWYYLTKCSGSPRRVILDRPSAALKASFYFIYSRHCHQLTNCIGDECGQSPIAPSRCVASYDTQWVP